MKKPIFKIFIVGIITAFVYMYYFQNGVATEKVNDVAVDNNTIDTLLNSNRYLVLGKRTLVKQIKIADTLSYKGFFQMAWFQDDVIITDKNDFENLEIFIKHAAIDFFDDYQVSVYKGTLKDPDFTSNPEIKMFITRIKEGCKDGINFAGHYTLIYWGCGTACQYGVVVDRKTGIIYDGYMSSLGSKFKKESAYIIFNAEEDDNKGMIPININSNVQIKLKVWEKNVFKAVVK